MPPWRKFSVTGIFENSLIWCGLNLNSQRWHWPSSFSIRNSEIRFWAWYVRIFPYEKRQHSGIRRFFTPQRKLTKPRNNWASNGLYNRVYQKTSQIAKYIAKSVRHSSKKIWPRFFLEILPCIFLKKRRMARTHISLDQEAQHLYFWIQEEEKMQLGNFKKSTSKCSYWYIWIPVMQIWGHHTVSSQGGDLQLYRGWHS